MNEAKSTARSMCCGLFKKAFDNSNEIIAWFEKYWPEERLSRELALITRCDYETIHNKIYEKKYKPIRTYSPDPSRSSTGFLETLDAIQSSRLSDSDKEIKYAEEIKRYVTINKGSKLSKVIVENITMIQSNSSELSTQYENSRSLQR